MRKYIYSLGLSFQKNLVLRLMNHDTKTMVGANIGKYFKKERNV